MSQRNAVDTRPGGLLDETMQAVERDLLADAERRKRDPRIVGQIVVAMAALEHLLKEWNDAAQAGDDKTVIAIRDRMATASHEMRSILDDCWLDHDVRRPALVPRAPVYARRRGGPRRRGAGRPAARRTVTTRGGDSGDSDSDSDPPPRPQRRATYSYACSPCPHCGAELRIFVDGLYCGNPSCAWGRS